MRRPGFPIVFLAVLLAALPAEPKVELVGDEGILFARKDSDLEAYLDGGLRLSYNHMSNVVGLGFDKKKVDFQDYMGELSFLGLDVKYREDLEAYVKISSYGQSKSDAIVLPDRSIHTIWGDVYQCNDKDLLPRLEEWWVKAPVGQLPATAKAGLFKYSVGSGLAMGGYYQNYGVDFSCGTESAECTAHFAVPDIENKWYLGPHLADDREKFNVKYDSRAYFFAGDAKMKWGDHSFQPYIGVLLDRTPAARRLSPYAASVNTEYLGTYGGRAQFKFGGLSLFGESAANFGKAWSQDPTLPDITHQGWMFNAGAAYACLEGKIIPRAKFYYLSGNKFVGDDITDGRIVKGVNREFSVYSPLNYNLSDTFYPAFGDGPYVFAGMGNSLNQGILYPNTFGDPYLMANLVAPNAGVDLKVTEKLTVYLDYWYLRSAEPGVGADYDDTTGAYSPYTLPTYLGNELDLYGEYAVNKNITFNLLTGIFLPGDYYRKRRSDNNAVGISSAPRYDGGSSNAWVVEAGVDYRF